MMMARLIGRAGLALLALDLAGCGGPGGAPLVSAQYPPGTGSVNDQSEPQPIGSLPKGAANVPAGPTAVQPNYLSWTFGVR